jgi:hypothetical protein
MQQSELAGAHAARPREGETQDMTSPIPNPSVGRTVHYVALGTPIRPDGTQAYPSVCRAAIITEVDNDPPAGAQEEVGLCVLNPTGQFFNRGVVHDEDEHLGGTWHWPEIV